MLGVLLELISAHSGRYEAIVVSFSGDVSFAVCFWGVIWYAILRSGSIQHITAFLRMSYIIVV